MAEHAFELVKNRAEELSGLIDGELYADAAKKLAQLDTAIRTLTSADIAQLSQEEQRFLFQLAEWLTDHDLTLHQRKRQLMDAIAPLNANSALKPTRQYQGKSSNG